MNDGQMESGINIFCSSRPSEGEGLREGGPLEKTHLSLLTFHLSFSIEKRK